MVSDFQHIHFPDNFTKKINFSKPKRYLHPDIQNIIVSSKSVKKDIKNSLIAHKKTKVLSYKQVVESKIYDLII